MRSCLGLLLLVFVSACDASPSVVRCDGDAGPDCCLAHPTRPECRIPSCEEDPTQEACQVSCEDDPFQDECAESCESDPISPRCEPPTWTPSAEVEVVRDSLGIPHIHAATDADAMWASGFMQASDRLFQMDIARRRVLGRQAEVRGPDSVDDDVLMRTLDLDGWAELALRDLETRDPDTYALLVAWTAGVNARIDAVNDGSAPMPRGFTSYGYAPERWRVVDGAAVGKLLIFGSGNQLEEELLATVLRQYVPDVWGKIPFLTPLEATFSVPAGDRPTEIPAGIVPPAFGPGGDGAGTSRELPSDARERLRAFHTRLAPIRGGASNNWAIGARFTATGTPMIAGDPHQPLRTPSLFWAHHMHSEQGLDVIGWSFVGAPAVHLGHNRRVVWTATVNYPDTMDLWDVVVDDQTTSIGGEAVRHFRRTETIDVAGGEPVSLEVVRVPGYGVILPDDVAPIPVARPGRHLLFNWTGFAPTRDFEAFFAMDRAGDVDAFQAALSGLEIGSFNYIAADRQDIFYGSSMWLPYRTVTESRLPFTLLDGDDAGSLWTQGFVDRSVLPTSRGAPRDILVTANNDPFGYTADGDVTNDPYYFGAFYDPGTRAYRAQTELERLAMRAINDRELVTLDDMRALQTDVHSRLADYMVPLLVDAFEQVAFDDTLAEYRNRAELRALFTLLTEWDRNMDRDQAAPVAFIGWINLFTQAALADEFGFTFEPILEASPLYLMKLPLLAATGAIANGDSMFQDGVAAAVMQALAGTASWLESVFGGVDPARYRWSDLHCTSLRPLVPLESWQSACRPTHGGEDTLDVSSASILREGNLLSSHESSSGAIYRMVATFNDVGVPIAEVNFPPGNVEDPGSPYFGNLLDDWLEGRYRPLPFLRDDVDADARETITLGVEE